MTHRRLGVRAVAAAAALTAASFSLAACSSGDGAAAGGATTITIATWYTDPEIIPSITAANAQLEKDDIVIEHTYVPLDQWNTWMSTQLSSGEGPDIVADGASFPARVVAGNLVPLTDDPILDNFNPAGLSLATDSEGDVYGIPIGGWFSAIYYNKDLFADAGIDVPTTFDEFLDASDTLDAAGIKPMAMGMADGDQALHSLTGYLENAYYNNGDGSIEVDHDFAYGKDTLTGNWNDAVKKWSKLISHNVLTPEMVGTSDTQALADFTGGKAAMYITGPWNYAIFKDAGMNFGVFPHVGSDAGNAWLLGGPAANIGINIDSKHPDQAKLAMEALASKESMQAFVDSSPGAFSYYTGVEGTFPAEYDLVTPILAEGNVGTAWDRWGVNMPAQSMVDTILKELQSVVSGQEGTDDMIKNLDLQADSVRY